MQRKITLPWMGSKYTELIKDSLENLGMNILLPPKTSDKTIKLGVKNSADMVCMPYKSTLGNFIESLDAGANTLIMYDSRGTCRFRHYWKVQEFTLKKLGYDFEMCNLNPRNFLHTAKKLSGKPYSKVIREFFNLYKKIKIIDEEKIRWSKNKPNIGIIGEIYTCCDETINYGTESKIKKFGAKSVSTVTLSEFIIESLRENFKIPFKDDKKQYKKQAKKYLNGPLGGHAEENLYNLLWLINNGINGVVHILPLSCAPEAMIEPYVNNICQSAKTPLLRIAVDENNSEANLETRLETFIELIKMRK